MAGRQCRHLNVYHWPAGRLAALLKHFEAAVGSAIAPGHAGRGPGLVDEDQPVGVQI